MLDGLELADELDLALPSVAWFAGRDRFAEYLDTLAEAATTSNAWGLTTGPTRAT